MGRKNKILVQTPLITMVNRHPWTWLHYDDNDNIFLPIGTKGSTFLGWKYKGVVIDILNSHKLNRSFSVNGSYNFKYSHIKADRHFRSYKVHVGGGLTWNLLTK